MAIIVQSKTAEVHATELILLGLATMATAFIMPALSGQ